MNCKICSSSMVSFAHGTILLKHNVKYFQCMQCGFVCTESPYWLDEAYQAAINRADVGLVQRNYKTHLRTKNLINFILGSEGGTYLDYGGGYALFVRLMRDAGFNYFWFDERCENIFAHGFSLEDSRLSSFDLVTAFEVFEHLVNPVDELTKILKYSENIFFTTLLFPSYNPRPGNWWYYGLEHGQHISFFTKKTLESMGSDFGLQLYSDGYYFHFLTKTRVSKLLFRLAVSSKSMRIFSVLGKRPSLLQKDYEDTVKQMGRDS